ncbi:MAG: hypothetical protein HY055_00185, partial [Magnetospirillum sp.]|nr:hypothetical protein [Magnetospirillum sp.]
MCGIFGIIASPQAGMTRALLEAQAERLFLLSESRGKEAAGLALLADNTIRVHKEAIAASAMMKGAAYRALFATLAEAGGIVALIGHSRLVTNGMQAVPANNQPVIKDGLVGIHNGIIVNDRALWARHPALVRDTEVDTEVLLALIAERRRQGLTLPQAVGESFAEIEGTAAIALLAEDDGRLVLATNNGSLYYAASGGCAWFASERYILETFLAGIGRAGCVVTALAAGRGALIDLAGAGITGFDLTSPPLVPQAPAVSSVARIINDLDRLDPEKADLRRCTRCILPETMPFIAFDADGVCNYCHEHPPIRPKGIDALRDAVAPFRRTDGGPDCLVAVSGGRDSCYGLHVIKQELGLNPIAYTYDWGMVTDLARRNQARLCGKLGIEHILVSADIAAKRDNVRRNVSAWLKRPELGMIPLFMAGDKQYFHFAELIRRQNGIGLSFLCENAYERARFKSGFCGIDEKGARVFNVKARQKLALAGYFARQYLLNPRYINRSLVDSAWAFKCSYMSRHDMHLQLFEYVPWEEDELVGLLRDEYDWELATDTPSSWRIG